jgi:hypothetical protein
MESLLCLVAWENLFSRLGRLQPFLCQARDLHQSAKIEMGMLFVAHIRRGLRGHPNRYREPLALGGGQVIGRWGPCPALPDPKPLPRPRVERIEDPRVLGIRILLTGSTVVRLF